MTVDVLFCCCTTKIYRVMFGLSTAQLWLWLLILLLHYKDIPCDVWLIDCSAMAVAVDFVVALQRCTV